MVNSICYIIRPIHNYLIIKEREFNMFTTTTYVVTGIGATLGFCAGAASAIENVVGKRDSLSMRIAKIVSLALFGALLAGTGTFGVCVIFETRGVALGVLLVALIALKLSARNRHRNA